jgi:hypothetical protein
LVSDIPAGDGKIGNLFYSVNMNFEKIAKTQETEEIFDEITKSTRKRTRIPSECTSKY